MSPSRSIIKFGTDGWRAIIGDGFTLDNLERVARATGEWLLDEYGANASVVVGYDTRFRGKDFAEHTSVVLASMGIRVVCTDDFAPTPAISWATTHYGHCAGVVITASHNPPEYNGFKIKGHFGGSALPEMVADVESRIKEFKAVDYPLFQELLDKGSIELVPVKSLYTEYLRTIVDLDLIRQSGITIVHDAMFGAGQGILSTLLGADRVIERRCTVNPGFEGTPPEPIERNLNLLRGDIVDNGADAAIANDGDADRIGMADEHGNYVDSHRLLALLVDYLHTDKGLTGSVVKTFSTTDMLDKMCAVLGIELETTAIGFKYIGDKILKGDVLVGGEESGGMAVKGHIPERDGLFIGLVILEMMARRGKQLSSLVADLHESYGYFGYYRVDVHTTEVQKQRILVLLKDEGGLKSIAGRPVRKLETVDGYKHRVDSGWLLIRPSGTEPVLRVYAEAESELAAEQLVTDALIQLGVS